MIQFVHDNFVEGENCSPMSTKLVCGVQSLREERRKEREKKFCVTVV